MERQQAIDCDVVIIGSGIIGLTLCNSLLKLGCRVGLVDKKMPSAHKHIIDTTQQAWVSALARPGQALFKKIGIWQELVQTAVPYQYMEVIMHHGEQIAFSHRDIGQENLGHIVNNTMAIQLLWRQLSSWKGQLYLFEDQPVSWCGDTRTLALQSGVICTSTILIGADGAGSWTRAASGIDLSINTRIEDHAHIGIINHNQPHQNRARQVFYEKGVIGLLPAQDPCQSICVWSTGKKNNDASHPSVAQLENELNQVFHTDHYRLSSGWKRHAIHTQQACRYVNKNVALVGDAAVCVHPLAGQGLNIGLRQVTFLTQKISAALRANALDDFFDYARSYESDCRGYDALSLQVINWCRTSTASRGVAQSVMGWGAQFINQSSYIKHLMIRHALEADC